MSKSLDKFVYASITNSRVGKREPLTMPNVAEVTLDCFRCHGSLFEENARRLLQEVSGPGSRISYPMPKMKKEKKNPWFRHFRTNSCYQISRCEKLTLPNLHPNAIMEKWKHVLRWHINSSMWIFIFGSCCGSRQSRWVCVKKKHANRCSICITCIVDKIKGSQAENRYVFVRSRR